MARCPWLTPERAASVAPGAAALVAVSRWLRGATRQRGGPQQRDREGEGEAAGVQPPGAMLVSDRDLLDGAALALLAQLRRGGGGG
jgi:hypothetical protein